MASAILLSLPAGPTANCIGCISIVKDRKLGIIVRSTYDRNTLTG